MKVDVIVIGAGPAGLTAAIELARQNISVVVIDEYYRPGGRLLGQHYEDPYAPSHERVWDGKKIAEQLAKSAIDLGVKIYTGVTTWSINKGLEIELTGACVNNITANAVLLATGSVEKALPIPGWTLPGAIGIGAAQTFTNLHKVSVGKKVLIVGIDPLALSVMLEMKNAGIEVVGIVLPPSSKITGETHTPIETLKRLTDVADLAPNIFLRTIGKFALKKFPALVAHVLRFNFLKVNGVPVFLRKSLMCIEGSSRVEAVTVQSVKVDGTPTGKATQIEVDTVCLSGGLYPMVDLAQEAGCPMVYLPELGGNVPVHGIDMATPIKGLYVAGNITGIEGAKVAIAQGQLAATSIARFLGKNSTMTVNEAIKEVENARKKSPLRFLPNIEEGRSKMNEIWKKEGII